jgi:hypothetical protein
MLIKLGVATRVLEILSREKVDNLILTDKSFFTRYAAIRQGWELDPNSFLYMRTRMVSALEKHGPNANGDAFLAKELARRYATFINAAVNIDHDNDDPKKAVGFIVDARYIPEEMYVEGIHAIDKVKAEAKRKGIIAAIESGAITDTSMGCYVEHSICSECLKEAGWDGEDFGQIEQIAYNKLSIGHGIATVPEEYCHHIGRYGEKKGGEGGPFEINCGVTFFEDSIITTAGADSNAKYLEKLAALGIDLTKLIINRSPFAEKIQGGNTVANKKTAEELRMDTTQEKGDYKGTPADKDQALHDQAKGKSEKTKPAGEKMDTQEEKGDYTLASKQVIEAIALVKKLAVDNPDIKDLIFDQKEIGGVPKAVEDGKKEQHQDKVDDANVRKEGDAAPGPVEEAPLSPEEKEMEKQGPVKTQGKKKGFFAKLLANLMKEALEMDGNPTETVKEEGDYQPKTGEPTKETFKTSKETAPKETDMKGNPTQTQEDSKEYPLTGARKPNTRPVRVADNEKAKVDSMVTQMQTGKSFDDAKKDVTEKFDGGRTAARRKMADDMNRGSMGSPGKPDGLAFKAEEEKPEDKKEEGKEKTAMDQPNESTDKRLNEGTDEKVETAPMRSDAGRRKADGVPPQFEKKEEPKKEGPVAEKPPMEKEEGKSCMGEEGAPVTPAPAAETAPMVKEDEATPEKAKEMVQKMDGKADALEGVLKMKKEQAALLAQSGYTVTAATKVRDIQKIDTIVTKMSGLANGIEELSAASVKQEGMTKRAVIFRLRKLMGVAKVMIAETDGIMDDMKKKDKEDGEKVEAAMRFAQEKKEKLASQKREAETKSRLTAMVKATAVKDLVKVGLRKGLVQSSELQAKIAELSKLSDVEFEATKKVWASLPDATSIPNRTFVPRKIREASRTGAGMSLTDPTAEVVGGDLERGTLFGTDHLQ